MKKPVLSNKQLRLMNYLAGGGKYAVADIMNALHIGDPRSDIRTLRNNGIVVNDVWVTTVTGSRYKRYWISQGKAQ